MQQTFEEFFQTFTAQFDKNRVYVLAVSGGVDSVVMLDLMAQIDGLKLVVAHFDHQIRGQTSTRDADFVRQLASCYGLKYHLGLGGLGQQASEDQARQARYNFLRSVAESINGIICTAHHQDDVIETIGLNLTRGTGWRGLAVLGADDLLRPLLMVDKAWLENYAKDQGLSWCEDETNQTDRYLRNRLRQRIAKRFSSEVRQLIIELYQRQMALRLAIDAENERILKQLIDDGRVFERYFWIMIDEEVAIELLNALIRRKWGGGLTRPQLERAIWGIKTALPHSNFQLGEGIAIKFTRREWSFDKK